MTRVDHAKIAQRSIKAVYALEFRISEVPPGSVLLMGVVVVFSVEWASALPKQGARTGRVHRLRAHSTDRRCDARCKTNNSTWRTGVVLRGPAWALKTYRVMVDSEVGRVDVPLALAVQSE